MELAGRAYEMLRKMKGAARERNRLKRNTLGCVLKTNGITTRDPGRCNGRVSIDNSQLITATVGVVPRDSQAITRL
jgi:hypothetical protein